MTIDPALKVTIFYGFSERLGKIVYIFQNDYKINNENEFTFSSEYFSWTNISQKSATWKGKLSQFKKRHNPGDKNYHLQMTIDTPTVLVLMFKINYFPIISIEHQFLRSDNHFHHSETCFQFKNEVFYNK